MNTEFAKRLLVRSAQLYESKSNALSKVEITNKINEIKYLADHKKASKQSIKHEIQSLENKLEGVFDLQKNLGDERKKQSQKESLLKKRIAQLEHQLEIGKDKAIHKKVERLSSILAEHIIKKRVAQDIHHIRSSKQIHQQSTQHTSSNQHNKDKDHTRSTVLQQQVDRLKTQLESKKTILDQTSIQIIEEKIHLLEIKLGLHIRPHWNNPILNTTSTNVQSEENQTIPPRHPLERQTNLSPPQNIPSPSLTHLPPPQKSEIKHTILLSTPPPPSQPDGIPASIKDRASNKSFSLAPPPKKQV